MRLIFGVLLMLVELCLALPVSAQTDTVKPLKVVVFAPVYLDSAFTETGYKLGRNLIPKYILPGLEFYNGVMLAIDSLNIEKAPVEVFFYDSKSITNPVEEVLERAEMTDISLIIASFNTRSDVKPLADFALQHNIPLISSIYPNDGGVTANPFFVMINPTLKTHIEAIYKYLHRAYPLENIILFRRSGAIEDMILSVFNSINKKTPGIPLKLKIIELSDEFTPEQVSAYLDSTRKNILLCGTLNEAFGMNLVKAVSSSKSYRSVIMGMPTWDGIKDLGKDAEIIYSTPYNFSRTDKPSVQLTNKYRAKYTGRPSDMVFKGFESMYHFTKLLLKYGNGLINNLSSKEYKLFNDFDIQPVTPDKENFLPDYLENKKIYFIRKMDGRVKSIN